MKHDNALKVAEALVEHFRPACTQIEIAGSIRRLKPEVKDIEILAVPDLSPVKHARLEFGKPVPPVHKTALDKMIADMLESGDIKLEKSGERYKKFWLNHAGIGVDLFLVLPPATWGVQAVIRTGPAEFSHWVVTRRKHGGALPNGYRVQDGAVWEGETKTKTLDGQTLVGFETEESFLDFLPLGWIEPKDREAKWGNGSSGSSGTDKFPTTEF